MPHYEFFCHACKKTFSKILTLVDYEEGGVVCPRCGSHKVEQCWSVSSVIHVEEERLRTESEHCTKSGH
jgi:putative FmdB family regulatory protein